jgi:hypothetical protein
MAMLDESLPVAQPKRKHAAVKAPLLTRAVLDKRTAVAKAFDRLVSDIHSDLGGRDQLSAIELALVEAFVGASVTLDQLNAKLLLGESINLAEHAQASNAMVRIGSRLGLQRRTRDVLPTLAQYLQHKPHEAAE